VDFRRRVMEIDQPAPWGASAPPGGALVWWIFVAGGWKSTNAGVGAGAPRQARSNRRSKR
jgi:hypothetical protein